MIATPHTRGLAVALLVLALAGACVGYGLLAPNPQAGRYPSSAHLVHNPDAYLGERVVISGTVVETTPLVVRTEYTAVRDRTFVRDTLRLTVTETQATPAPGAIVQVYGTLTAPRTISATTLVVVPAQNRLYMYGISFLAGVWVLTRLLRQWRLDRQRGCLVPREAPLRLRTMALSWLGIDEDHDA